MATRLARVSAGLGIAAGAVTSIIATTTTPHFPATAIALFARAIVLVGLVFATAFITTYAGFLIYGEPRTPQVRRISFEVAMTILWLPPLMMFTAQQSWLGLILWPIFLFHMARFLAFLTSQAESEPLLLVSPTKETAFSLLKRDFPYASSILGALLLQSALFAIISGHDAFAALFYFFGTAAMAYRTFQMFRAHPTRDVRAREKIAPMLGTVTLLTVFAWLPSLAGNSIGTGSGISGGGGALPTGSQPGAQGTGKRAHARPERATTFDWLRSLLRLPQPILHADSFAAAKHILGAKFQTATAQAEVGSRPQHQTGIPNREPVVGPVFPGVELYPEITHQTKLVAPPPQKSAGFGAAHSDPLSIPFDGVYRFWKGPGEGPPPNVVVMHGSPSARFFRSTDHEIMSMEARESLGFSVDPRFYSAIEIVLENVDPFPNTVSIALRIRDSANPGKRSPSLGLLRVSAVAQPSGGHPKMQTLRFAVPATSSRFDELVVTYYLRGERSDRSARIAIQGFRLVPRAG